MVENARGRSHAGQRIHFNDNRFNAVAGVDAHKSINAGVALNMQYFSDLAQRAAHLLRDNALAVNVVCITRRGDVLPFACQKLLFQTQNLARSQGFRRLEYFVFDFTVFVEFGEQAAGHFQKAFRAVPGNQFLHQKPRFLRKFLVGFQFQHLRWCWQKCQRRAEHHLGKSGKFLARINPFHRRTATIIGGFGDQRISELRFQSLDHGILIRIPIGLVHHVVVGNQDAVLPQNPVGFVFVNCHARTFRARTVVRQARFFEFHLHRAILARPAVQRYEHFVHGSGELGIRSRVRVFDGLPHVFLGQRRRFAHDFLQDRMLFATRHNFLFNIVRVVFEHDVDRHHVQFVAAFAARQEHGQRLVFARRSQFFVDIPSAFHRNMPLRREAAHDHRHARFPGSAGLELQDCLVQSRGLGFQKDTVFAGTDAFGQRRADDVGQELRRIHADFRRLVEKKRRR